MDLPLLKELGSDGDVQLNEEINLNKTSERLDGAISRLQWTLEEVERKKGGDIPGNLKTAYRHLVLAMATLEDIEKEMKAYNK